MTRPQSLYHNSFKRVVESFSLCLLRRPLLPDFAL